MSIEETVDRFFSAIEAGDLAELDNIYSADAKVWHNFTGLEQDKAANLARLKEARAAAQIRYEIVERFVIGDRVVQRHVVHLDVHDGPEKLTLYAAVFITVSDSKIVRIDEYLDPSQSVMSLLRNTGD